MRTSALLRATCTLIEFGWVAFSVSLYVLGGDGKYGCDGLMSEDILLASASVALWIWSTVSEMIVVVCLCASVVAVRSVTTFWSMANFGENAMINLLATVSAISEAWSSSRMKATARIASILGLDRPGSWEMCRSVVESWALSGVSPEGNRPWLSRYSFPDSASLVSKRSLVISSLVSAGDAVDRVTRIEVRDGRWLFLSLVRFLLDDM